MKKAGKVVLACLIVLFVLIACAVGVVDFGIYLVDRSGWSESEDGSVRYLDQYAEPLLGWQIIGKKTYYFDPQQDGAMARGWMDTPEGRCYFSQDGILVTGWLEEDGCTYYLREDGTMLTGWLELEEKRYFFGDDGVMRTGWAEMDEGRRYFDETGVMLTGWLEYDAGRYYLDESGVMLTGWLELEEGRYYLGGDGTMTTGWMDTSEGRYYLNETGLMHTGWLEYEEEFYYMAPDGAMIRGWVELEDGRYYLAPDGTRYSGWLKFEDERYYLADDGTMTTGWLELSGDRYYMNPDGTMAVGQVVIDEVSSFFTSQGKYVVLVNRWNPVPEDYKPDLVEYGGYQIDASCLDALDRMLADCAAAGYTYYLNSVYRSLTDQQDIWDTRYAGYIAEGYSEEEANRMVSQSVAVPGTSEHHLGLAADIGGSEEMYAWMRENSWKYGFIVRYPSGKTNYTGIIYEPWHVRYVGVELAKELYDLGLCMEEYMEMLTEE